MACEVLTLFLCVIVAAFLGTGYYESFRTGVLTVKGYTSRRDKQPIMYWIGMTIGVLAFLVTVSGAALTAFLLCMDVFGRSK